MKFRSLIKKIPYAKSVYRKLTVGPISTTPFNKDKIPLLLKDLYLYAKGNNDLEQKLRLYSFVARCYWDNPSVPYVNKELEEDLLLISKKVINFDLDKFDGKNTTLHVMSQAYITGGHTRVVDNWIKALRNYKHSVIFNFHSSVYPAPKFLIDTVHNSGGDIIYNDKSSMIEKAKYLAKVASKYKYVVLHHHPSDILPLVAFGNSRFSRPTFFYNQGDNVWGCGYSVSDYILDLSSFGVDFSHKYRGIPKSRSINIGIPVEIDKYSCNTLKRKGKVFRIASMAAAYKYKPLSKLSFQDFVDKVLSCKENIVFSIIGVGKRDSNWSDLLKKYGNRISFLGVLEKKEAHRVLKQADLYIDSFPFASYTSLIEAVSLGVPSLSLRNIMNNLDMVSKLGVATVEELVDKVMEVYSFSNKQKEAYVKDSVNYIYDLYSLESFKKKITKLYQDCQKHDPIIMNDILIKDDFIKKYADFCYGLTRNNNFLYGFKSFEFGRLKLKDRLEINKIAKTFF
jgi:hypothetical protein